MMQHDDDNTAFEQAVAFVNQTSRNLFLTGKAGTGKTTFLRYIRENSLKKIAVTAPTGVAAINAGGMTLHSFFQLPFGTYLAHHKTAWGESNTNIYNKNQLLGNLKFNAAKRDIFKELDLLVIDEISMVRADTLDAIDAILRSVRRRPYDPFGGVQMLYIGDLFQLPPVVKAHEWQLLAETYQSPFFFDALVLKESPPVYLELKKIYRQSDSEFISILNNIRNNCADSEDLELLHLHYDPAFAPYRDEGYITLTSHNYQADNINKEELQKLPGWQYKLDAVIEKDFPENAYPMERTLYLKEGAQIMFIKNDKGENRRYYNGKIGTVERIDEAEDKVLVRFTGEPDLLLLEKEVWKNIRYNYDRDNDEIGEEVLGTFTQYPIRLAWAVTIHKSQGLTFDKAIVDAGQSFAPGQVYVALSRLTGLQGLVLRSRITPQSITTDPRVLEFTAKGGNADLLQSTLEKAQYEFINESLLKAFYWDKLADAAHENLEAYAGRTFPGLNEAIAWGRDLAMAIDKEKQTAEKFTAQLVTLMHSGNNGQLHDRTQAAVNWFVTHMDEQVIGGIKTHIEAVRIKARTKKYVKELQELLTVAERKKEQLVQVSGITEGLHNSAGLAEIMNRVARLHAPVVISNDAAAGGKTKAAPGESKRISLQLFNEGRTPAEIAEIRNFAESTISGHLAEFVLTGELPATRLVTEEKLAQMLQELRHAPGMTWTELKIKLGDSYSYSEIKVAVNHWKWLQEREAAS